MFVDEFIYTFAGERTLSLLRCMAVANGNSALDTADISPIEAKRYLISYQSDITLAATDWTALRDELYESILGCRSDAHRIRRTVCRLMMNLRRSASYFHPGKAPDANRSAVSSFFDCIVRSIGKATLLLEATGYASGDHLGDYNHKWNKPCFHDIARIGAAIDRLGNIIQGCLYETGITSSVFDYQTQCGVTLVEAITPESLAASMDWTAELARYYIGTPDSDTRIAPLSTIAELRRAIADGKVDTKGHLLCSNRAFVLYCYDLRMFLPMNKTDWKPIDRLLTSDKGKTLTADTLAKVAHQLRKEEYIEDRIRFGSDHFTE